MSEFVIICGLSGAGRSQSADALEDLGWFVIDNLPPSLVPKVAELALVPGGEASYDRVALVLGVGKFQDEVLTAVADLRATGSRVRILYLEADDTTLITRFETTRRRHPLSDELRVAEAIAAERQLLEPVRAEADVLIDTTNLNVHELKRRLGELFDADVAGSGLHVSVQSFGFKHGHPVDADLVFDCRFLPNPHWVDELRPLTGLDERVSDYVLGFDLTKDFLERVEALLELLLPAYAHEGKSYLTIALGCTGGRHRSVYLAERLARHCRETGWAEVATFHRELD